MYSKYVLADRLHMTVGDLERKMKTDEFHAWSLFYKIEQERKDNINDFSNT